MNEGIIFLKNSKRIRRYLNKIKAKTRKIENGNLQSFIQGLERAANEFENIEREFKDGNKKEARKKYSAFVKENKELVDKINSESFKKLLKVLGVGVLVATIGLAIKLLFDFTIQTDELGATRIDKMLKTEDQLLNDFITRKAKEANIDPKLVRGIIKQESDWEKHQISTNKNGTKDYGLMQLNSGYIKYYKEKFWPSGKKFDPLDPEDNVTMGIKYLDHLIRYYKGDVDKAIQAYNMGPTAIDAGKKATAYLNAVKAKSG